MGHKVFLYIAISLTLIIIVGSFAPIDDYIKVEFDWSDKVLHCVSYFALSFSWFLSVKVKKNSINFRVIVAAIILCFGIIIEVSQGAFTSYRQFDFLDIVANFVGITLAFLVFSFFYKEIKVILKNMLVLY